MLSIREDGSRSDKGDLWFETHNGGGYSGILALALGEGVKCEFVDMIRIGK